MRFYQVFYFIPAMGDHDSRTGWTVFMHPGDLTQEDFKIHFSMPGHSIVFPPVEIDGRAYDEYARKIGILKE